MSGTVTRKTNPVLYLFLLIPFGISNGYVVVTLAYLFAQAGLGAVAIAALGAWSLFPQTWKFVFGPVVDATLSTKAWYLITAIMMGLLIIAASLIKPSASNFNFIAGLVVLFSTASAINGLASQAIIAHATSLEEKGSAGGWSQGGNLGGSGLGGGLGLWLSQNATASGDTAFGHWLSTHTGLGWFEGAGLWVGQHVGAGAASGLVVGLICLLCCLVLPYVHEPDSADHSAGIGESLAAIGKDALALICSRNGLLAACAFALPIGAAAMTQLWSGVALDWHASAGWVALVNGALGGVLSLIGCVIGGWLCDRMNRMTALNIFSVATAACSLGMALAPRSETTFILFVCIYMVLTGFCYGAYGAVVLEAVGKGAAATKVSILVSIANFPIIYLSLLDGAAHDRWGATGMLLADAVIPVLGTLLFIAFAIATRRFYRGKPDAAT